MDNTVLPIWKNPGMTSYDVVRVIKNQNKKFKVGHCGTLDPFAEGVLLVCTGKETKNINNLILGYVKCPIEICARRDPKGLYQKAFNKEINTLIGVNRPYIEPDNPDIILYSGQSSLAAIYKQIIEYLNTARYLIKNDHSE